MLLEDDNQYNEAIANVNILINKEYDKYLNSTDVEAPNKFDKTLNKEFFKYFK